jgi:hypothetical protein
VLGPPKPRRLDQAIAVSLEDLVPAGNFYRHLEAKLDPGFVREGAKAHVADRSADRSATSDRRPRPTRRG